MSQLTQMLDEARRLLTIYEEHKNSPDSQVRRKVHVDMDRFLMENREVATLLLISGLEDALEVIKMLNQPEVKVPPQPWYKRLLPPRKESATQ